MRVCLGIEKPRKNEGQESSSIRSSRSDVRGSGIADAVGSQADFRTIGSYVVTAWCLVSGVVLLGIGHRWGRLTATGLESLVGSLLLAIGVIHGCWRAWKR
jgi:hypothetical protein